MKIGDLVWTRKAVKTVSDGADPVVALRGVSGCDFARRMLPDHPALPALAGWLATNEADAVRFVSADDLGAAVTWLGATVGLVPDEAARQVLERLIGRLSRALEGHMP